VSRKRVSRRRVSRRRVKRNLKFSLGDEHDECPICLEKHGDPAPPSILRQITDMVRLTKKRKAYKFPCDCRVEYCETCINTLPGSMRSWERDSHDLKCPTCRMVFTNEHFKFPKTFRQMDSRNLDKAKIIEQWKHFFGETGWTDNRNAWWKIPEDQRIRIIKGEISIPANLTDDEI